MLKLKKVSFSYTEKDETFTVTTERSVSNDRMSLDIDNNCDIITVMIHTDNEIQINHLSAVFEYPFTESDKIFLNGYQSWTDSIEHGINDSMRGIDHLPDRLNEKYGFSQYGDYNLINYANYPGIMHGWTYGYVRNGNEYNFFGSLAEKSGFTAIVVSTEKNEIQFQKDCNGHTINSDYCGLKLMISSDSEDSVFDQYFKLLNIKIRDNVRPLFGYTSWYRHYQNISEDILIDDLEALTDQGNKADIFQIDDGWQTHVGDWLSVNEEKFSSGMAAIADKIKEKGLQPGLWIAPFVCEKDSDIFQNNEKWILKDDENRYIKGGSNWSGCYALDIYDNDFREYLRKVFHTVIHEWGFTFLKLDFLYAACIQQREDRTRGQVMADAMEFLREISDGALLLGCGVPLGSAFGMVDYCRIGCDVSLDWNDKPHLRILHRERISTRNSILNSVFRRQLDGRAFYNDPDVFMLRDEETTMTHAQKQCLAEINAMMGSVLFTSDNLNDYDETTLKILKKIFLLRNAKVISADLIGDFLIIKFSIGDKKFLRKYKV